ncbi:MAG: hypothetical protein US89_C0004G0028 [Candidatus Peregrinibacteria bacterium GW2011_GWF2_38_29]|nr:MAG: hypothetical protein US89_C0004G0028 [Candidatus Peregrinibacteria bacterium GW2011_GWF2_38_29]HBB02965.1 hypothetical protein [Candidatus Peregrinibacteria bacterium]
MKPYDPQRIDDIENRAFAAAFEAVEQESRGGLHDKFIGHYKEEILRALEPDQDPSRSLTRICKESLRDYARHSLEESQRSGYLEVTKEVVTQFAIKYFKALKEYLKAREDEKTDIDEIVEEVRINALLLLRQVEDALPEDNRPLKSRNRVSTDWFNLKWPKLIDMGKVERQLEIWNLFKESITNHYLFTAKDGRSLGATHHNYSGIRMQDILFILNSEEDVGIHRHIESRGLREEDHLATLHPNGLIDIVKESP